MHGTFRISALALLAAAALCPVWARAQQPEMPDSIVASIGPDGLPTAVVGEEFTAGADSLTVTATESMPVLAPYDPLSRYNDWEERDVVFNPSPTRAVWLSALFPGLGQVYNRRYWKLPIIAGAYLGLGYATSWNNTMLRDYSRAYRDIMDNDPATNSYMNFFPPTVKEDELDRQWLTNMLQSRKNYFRRNRDLCIIAMAGVYLLAMVDAYVDASLSHFDLSDDLSIDVNPALFQDGRGRLPSVGLQWALNF